MVFGKVRLTPPVRFIVIPGSLCVYCPPTAPNTALHAAVPLAAIAKELPTMSSLVSSCLLPYDRDCEDDPPNDIIALLTEHFSNIFLNMTNSKYDKAE